MSIFSKIEQTRVKSNKFDLTHDVKMSAQFGKITPCCVIDCIPGDKFNIRGNAMVRLAPMIAPVMHRANIYMHYFFVPNRIIWDSWEDFITGGEDGTLAPVHPFLSWQGGNPGQLGDYLGLPPSSDMEAGATIDVNALPFAAYQKIYSDYFRDQNFAPEQEYQLADGNNSSLPSIYGLKTRAWEHDYFTSALPWTQRGPEVLLPLGDEAPIVPEDPANVIQFLRDAQGGGVNGGTQVFQNTADGQINYDGTGIPAYVAVEESHKVDLTDATASSINDLRRAFRLQEFLEKNARGGARYIESISAHFGVSSSDKRLQRAEYIGGFSSPIKFSEVLQTSSTSSDVQIQSTPQGNMAGHGISVGGSKSYNYTCEEHGYIIGVMSTLPKTAYQNGVQKHFLRKDKFDYAWPSFAHIGEQPIQNAEVFVNASVTTQNETWGYTPRYAEYKFMNNRVAGSFRDTLDIWHMGRKFSSLPPLNIDFIEMDSEEVDRIWAVSGSTAQTDPPLWIQVLNQVKVSRKLPIFGTPRI